jgi:predicted flap endonuclease-1-like 5' DNA nuclease
MLELISDNWIFFLLALAIGIAVAWWIFVASRRTRVERTETAPDGEVTTARRNQALIDTPPAAAAAVTSAIPPAAPGGMAGVGEAVAAAAAPVTDAPAAASTSGDDLKKIKGIGPKLEKLLNSLGVTTYAQIGAWDDAEIDRIDAQLGTFQGRIRRDDWPAQARFLAQGDVAGFENRFGKA